MSHNRYDNSCHRIALDTWMKLDQRFRFSEVQEMWNDYEPEEHELVDIDADWIASRASSNICNSPALDLLERCIERDSKKRIEPATASMIKRFTAGSSPIAIRQKAKIENLKARYEVIKKRRLDLERCDRDYRNRKEQEKKDQEEWRSEMVRLLTLPTQKLSDGTIYVEPFIHYNGTYYWIDSGEIEKFQTRPKTPSELLSSIESLPFKVLSINGVTGIIRQATCARHPTWQLLQWPVDDGLILWTMIPKPFLLCQSYG